jgi:hypothetical protein
MPGEYKGKFHGGKIHMPSPLYTPNKSEIEIAKQQEREMANQDKPTKSEIEWAMQKELELVIQKKLEMAKQNELDLAMQKDLKLAHQAALDNRVMAKEYFTYFPNRYAKTENWVDDILARTLHANKAGLIFYGGANE